MEMNVNQNEQNKILSRVISEKQPITLYTINGVQLRGIVTAYDDTVISLLRNGVQAVVYKHAISTIETANPTD